MSQPEQDIPPVGEEIHLPGPTALPVFSAASITMIVIGTTIGPDFMISIAGLILFLVTTVMWVRHTRRDMSELPEDHAQH